MFKQQQKSKSSRRLFDKKIKTIDSTQQPKYLSVSSVINITNRCTAAIKSIEDGMNEKTIIKEVLRRQQSIHPTQKPVRLLERLLNLVCNEGCTVLDPFSGSASTAIACINSKRNYIGFEIDKEYYDLSQERIAKHLQTINDK